MSGGKWKNTGLGHTKHAFYQKYHFKIRIQTRQDWQTLDKIIEPNVDLWFTDGWEIHDCFGTGIFAPVCYYRESIPMGSLFMVFSA
jgi:hypothetical protein